jgi:hypothetical protein
VSARARELLQDTAAAGRFLNELPSVEEYAASALQRLAGTVGRDSQAGAALGSVPDVATAAARAGAEPRRAFLRAVLDGGHSRR